MLRNSTPTYALNPVLSIDSPAHKLQQYFEIRSNKINALRASKQPNPYPHKFHTNYKLADFIRDYSHLKKGETEPDKEIRIGLRVMTQRSASNALHFYVCTYTTYNNVFIANDLQARLRVSTFKSCVNCRKPRPTYLLRSSMRTSSVETLSVSSDSQAVPVPRRVVRVS